MRNTPFIRYMSRYVMSIYTSFCVNRACAPASVHQEGMLTIGVIFFFIGNLLLKLFCYSIEVWLIVHFSVNSTARRQLYTFMCPIFREGLHPISQSKWLLNVSARFYSWRLNALARCCFSQWLWHNKFTWCFIVYFKYFPHKNIYQVGCVSHAYVFYHM